MSVKRKRKKKSEEQKALDAFHKVSERHVLVDEAALTEDQKRHVFAYAENIRRCSNALTGIMQRRLDQLRRTKRYRRLQELYGKAASSGDDDRKEALSKQMQQMQQKYLLTWEDCRKAVIDIQDKYCVGSIFALTCAEDVWAGVEKTLYSDGKRLHFHSRGDLPVIRTKQRNRGIVVKQEKKQLVYSFNDIKIRCIPGDRFIRDETNAVMHYLLDAERIDRAAASAFTAYGELKDTFRPCYASIVCRQIRGKLRVFIHLTIEGKAMPKYDRHGDPRHTYGKGHVGADIGTQTIAYTSASEVGLKNLAERGSSIRTVEQKERRILRAMDRSRRETNPDNYNSDRTIRKGKKRWFKSKRYRKLQRQHQELSRIAAENRRLAIHEDVNHLRSLGDTFITEPPNAKKLMKKAAPTKTPPGEKPKRRKRFGRSIQNRCPGYFQEKVKQVFTSSGGAYIEVPMEYRASQYDHPSDDYIKKRLSQRMFRLSDGTLVQRDWYSSFLLFCCDIRMGMIDKSRLHRQFESLYLLQNEMIDRIRTSGIKVMNSGIR